MVPEYGKREGSPIPTTLVPSDKAPVHEVVLTGNDIDITKLPTLVHQELDAGRYITSAVSKLPGIGGEFEVMGGLLGESVEMVNCKTVSLQVPAHAEIVIEGFVDTDPTKVQNEGPFGEYPLYYTRLGPMPWLQVTAVPMRKQPIYVDVFNAHKEH